MKHCLSAFCRLLERGIRHQDFLLFVLLVGGIVGVSFLLRSAREIRTVWAEIPAGCGSTVSCKGTINGCRYGTDPGCNQCIIGTANCIKGYSGTGCDCYETPGICGACPDWSICLPLQTCPALTHRSKSFPYYLTNKFDVVCRDCLDMDDPNTTCYETPDCNFPAVDCNAKPNPNGYCTDVRSPNACGGKATCQKISTCESGGNCVTTCICAWIQTRGGDVHGNDLIKTYVHNECIAPSCNPFFSLSQRGVVSSGSTAPHPINDKLAAVISSPAPGWQVTDIAGETEKIGEFGSNHTIYNFQFFNEKLGTGASAFNGHPPSGDGVFYIQTPSITTSGNWSNLSGKYVILIDGNLEIAHEITVNPLGFLAFIVKGNITVKETLGNNIPSSGIPPAPDTSTIEGIFIADGTINTLLGNSGHERFVGRGIFIADADLDPNGDFILLRNLMSKNKTYASEYFEYRPDFLINFPQEFGTKRLRWEEVAP